MVALCQLETAISFQINGNVSAAGCGGVLADGIVVQVGLRRLIGMQRLLNVTTTCYVYENVGLIYLEAFDLLQRAGSLNVQVQSMHVTAIPLHMS